MAKELELWNFVAARLEAGSCVMLLIVAESSGSSPGRQGYKMAVGADGELSGSIGGGVMEVNLVEQSRDILCGSPDVGKGGTINTELKQQVHRKNDPDSSGMICSGKQTIIFKVLLPSDLHAAKQAIVSITEHRSYVLQISPSEFTVASLPPADAGRGYSFEKASETEFRYREKLGPKNELYIIGGGHCALALSELLSKMDFRISIFDDRPQLNTIEKNRFADAVHIIDSYERIADHIRSEANTYIVVMTLGYRSDAAAIRSLIETKCRYFGVLGSKAKMATLLRELKDEGLPADRLDRIHTPIGLPINSRTPEEIAVSIAAEIISVKNG